jgi:hypothetical protein
LAPFEANLVHAGKTLDFSHVTGKKSIFAYVLGSLANKRNQILTSALLNYRLTIYLWATKITHV